MVGILDIVEERDRGPPRARPEPVLGSGLGPGDARSSGDEHRSINGSDESTMSTSGRPVADREGERGTDTEDGGVGMKLRAT